MGDSSDDQACHRSAVAAGPFAAVVVAYVVAGAADAAVLAVLVEVEECFAL